VQLHTIPVALGGGDVIVQAKSGTGAWDPFPGTAGRLQETHVLQRSTPKKNPGRVDDWFGDKNLPFIYIIIGD